MDEIVDRISWLPPLIIHHVMSYLSPKEVAKISTLSKRWNELWTSFPILDFDQSYFLTEDESNQITSEIEEDRWALCDRLNEFMEFVDASLLRFCKLRFSMHRLRLSISIVDVEESAPYIDKWIGMATEKGVKEFDLEFLTDGEEDDITFSFPQTIFYAKSVTILKLYCSGSRIVVNISDIIRFNSFRKLSFYRVILNEETVQKLSDECPLLEEMSFSECWGFEQLCVSKALKLKILSIAFDNLESVEVVAPNLQELVLYSLSSETPRVIDIVGCSKLKRLEFGGIVLTDQQFHHFISSFPLLEDLILSYCHGLERIDQLKDLIIVYCFAIKRITISSDQLKKFRVSSCPNMTILTLKEFLGVSNQIEALSVYFKSNVSPLELSELTKSFISHLFKVENHELCIEEPDYMSLLDGRLWFCYPRSFSLKRFEVQHKLFEYSIPN